MDATVEIPSEEKPIIYNVGPAAFARVAQDDPKVLEVINQPGEALPMTGGSGTLP